MFKSLDDLPGKGILSEYNKVIDHRAAQGNILCGFFICRCNVADKDCIYNGTNIL